MLYSFGTMGSRTESAGSVFDPILFPLHMNDLPDSVLHSSVNMLADDAQLNMGANTVT